MEDIITYVLVFGVIIGGVAIWQLRRSKSRPYILSNQKYPELEIQVIVRKQEGKTKDFVIQIQTRQDCLLNNISIELISKTRSFENLDSGLIKDHIEFPLTVSKNQTVEFVYPFLTFKKYLTDQTFSFRTFRVVLQTEKDKKFKSHEMAFNKNWVIYRPDSGNYN